MTESDKKRGITSAHQGERSYLATPRIKPERNDTSDTPQPQKEKPKAEE